jgi:hypothetical protein
VQSPIAKGKITQPCVDAGVDEDASRRRMSVDQFDFISEPQLKLASTPLRLVRSPELASITIAARQPQHPRRGDDVRCIQV